MNISLYYNVLYFVLVSQIVENYLMIYILFEYIINELFI